MYYIEQKREASTKKKRTGDRLFIDGVRKEEKVGQEDKIYQIIIYLLRRVGEKRKIKFVLEKR